MPHFTLQFSFVLVSFLSCKFYLKFIFSKIKALLSILFLVGVYKRIVSGDLILGELTLRFRRSRVYWLIVQHVLAFGNVTLGGGLIEFSSAMGTLNVIAVIANRWRWQIAELASCGQVCLHLLGRAYGVNEILVFAPPVRLHLWFLRFLKHAKRQPFHSFRTNDILRFSLKQ